MIEVVILGLIYDADMHTINQNSRGERQNKKGVFDSLAT